jgi:hypothetical protein
MIAYLIINFLYYDIIVMFYPLESFRERLLYLGPTGLGVVCADYDSKSDLITTVKIPQLDGKTVSAWGISTTENNIKVLSNKNIKKVTIDDNCIIMNLNITNMGHYLAMLYKYLRYTSLNIKLCVYRDVLPQNIKLILEKVYPNNFIYLERNIIYHFKTLFMLFNVHDNQTMLYYDHSVYHCRPAILNYVESKYKTHKTYDKILLAKRETHLNKSSQISKNGLVGDKLVQEYIDNGYVNIDTYQTNILEVIHYIRNAKEIVISFGTTLYCHMPFFKNNANVTVLFNTEYMNEIWNVVMHNHKNTSIEKYFLAEYNPGAMYYLIFLDRLKYKIGFITTNSSLKDITYESA